MIRGITFLPGIPAAGHLTTFGWWHAGSLDSCPKCETITTPAPISRGANLMSETITAAAQDSQPDRSVDPAYCQFDAPPREYGAEVGGRCGAPATHWPQIDDAHSAHLRLAGVEDEEAQPVELPLCDDHYAQLLKDIAEQPKDDPYRIWIAAEPRVLVIGYTQPQRHAAEDYVPTMDGYKPGARQHELMITVPLPPNLQPHRIAELVFIATNAPELDPGSPEELIRLAIEDTGYKGAEAHWSVSVGDTVAIEGGPRYACENVSWIEVAR